ncbi:uncharacterized protein F4812DRAFT_111176 [Daldinia caldariorum]|uniref:uncharacterized protein n=1 Tax=Daldinia caldariorum TaxID=326644 RepID=UPI002008A5EA|nr:uncharacterized protein F4812DRAFT_111176 [Daldinia caldariorum]KAI1465762.1 hypothetical protein F4812DRAFT_111176 [Daldinia caldariorum]
MVNGLEKLERFFGNSRRRDKEKATRTRDVSIVSTPTQSPNGPHFPSPSFMHPTSTHMKPREEPVPWSRLMKERSQSLPDPPGSLKRRSSISIISNHRHHPSDPIRLISLLVEDEDTTDMEMLSRFKFPDSHPTNEHTDVSSIGDTGDRLSREHSIQEFPTANILDWCPRRLSSLFNNLGLDTSIDSIDNRLARFPKDGIESLVSISSPTPSSPPSPRTKINPFAIPPRKSSRILNEALARNLTISTSNLSQCPVSTYPPDSPPASDGEEDYEPTVIHGSTSIKGLSSPIEFTPRPSSDSVTRPSSKVLTRDKAVRESWGVRTQDPALICSTQGEIACISQPHMVQNSTGIVSILAMSKHAIYNHYIREPSLDDFFALDDEDVAERLPATPIPEADIPPTPPPKFSPKTPIGRSCSTRHVPIAPTTVINPISGELTPPRTPTDSQFLSLAYSPSTTSAVSGAMWAANIARTYNFDLVYIVDLWPKAKEESSDLDQSTFTHCQHDAANADSVTTQHTITAHKKPGMTGRILAAYGLSEFGSPFRIHAEFHRNMLRCRGWNEYRDELASPEMISRGWACSFYTGYSSTARNAIGEKHIARGGAMDRGIVFAAYTRKTTKSVIPVRSSPKQTAILGKLLYDSQKLVDVLVHGD